MNPETLFKIGAYLLQLAFFAGALWALLRQMKKDLKGIGDRQRASDKLAEQRFRRNIVVLYRAARDQESKDLIVESLLED